jgi:hypothetical protein
LSIRRVEACKKKALLSVKGNRLRIAALRLKDDRPRTLCFCLFFRKVHQALHISATPESGIHPQIRDAQPVVPRFKRQLNGSGQPVLLKDAVGLRVLPVIFVKPVRKTLGYGFGEGKQDKGCGKLSLFSLKRRSKYRPSDNRRGWRSFIFSFPNGRCG